MTAAVAEIEWQCRKCGLRGWAKPGIAKKKKYCSRRCGLIDARLERGKTRLWKEPTPCGVCGQPFVPARVKQRNCSVRCGNESKRGRYLVEQPIERPCEMCGEMFKPALQSAGRYCSRACFFKGNKGSAHGAWKGGRYINTQGYVIVYAPNHPRGGRLHQVAEHIIVMEAALGRYLRPGEEVHHRNGVKDDNRIENLELWTKSHPAGQRVVDMLEWAHMIIEQYEPEKALLSKGTL